LILRHTVSKPAARTIKKDGGSPCTSRDVELGSLIDWEMLCRFYGWLPTLGIVILTAVLGTIMLRQQGLATLNRARERLGSGEMPAQQLLEGMLLMVGGVLLLTPGFVTDAFGFACLIPWSRQWLASKIAARAVIGGVGFGGVAGGAAAQSPHNRGTAGIEVGSGSTDGADQADTTAGSFGQNPGGRPQRQPSNPGRGKDVEDAEFREIDD